MELRDQYSRMVKVYDNILSDDWCDKLISIFESSKNQEYLNHNHTPCFTQLNINQHHPDLIQDLVVVIQKAYGNYCADIKNKHIPRLKSLEEFRVKRYLPNSEERFDEHVDVVNHSSAIRAVAFLFYLNDNDGNTVFPLHDLKIKPKHGRVLVFPPTWEYPHAGLSSSDNSKYILSTYIHYGTN